jgi:hypothetical protein
VKKLVEAMERARSPSLRRSAERKLAAGSA